MPTPLPLIADLRNNPDPDARVLVQLAEAGSDLRQPHTLEFAFETDRESAALALAEALAALNCEVELQAPEADDDPPNHWVIARRTLVPVWPAVQSLSARFEALARQHGASYDGWGAEIVE